jgi:hypothetical protein
MRCLPLAFFVCCALLRGFATAQMSTLPAAKAIADLPGPPKNPPIFSEMTVILQGGWEYVDTANFKGSVAEVRRERIQLPNQSPNPHNTTTAIVRVNRAVRRIAHDFADAFVEQQRLNRPEEWKDQFKTHSGNLVAMEAQRIAGLPREKSKPSSLSPGETREGTACLHG